MKKLMLSFLLTTSLFAADLLAQQPCFAPLYKDGMEAMKKKNYPEAKRLFIAAAKGCDGLTTSQKTAALEKAEEADKKERNALENARKNAESERRIAIKAKEDALSIAKSLAEQLKVSKATQYAFGAKNELRIGNFEDGLALAFIAYDSIVNQLTPYVKNIFGDAVLAKYKQVVGDNNGHRLLGAISATGKYILTPAQTDSYGFWRNDPVNFSPILIKSFLQKDNPIRAAIFSPDEQHLLIGLQDGGIEIWRDNGLLVRKIIGHTAEVSGLVFSSEGNSFLSWSRDGTARMWGKDGQPLAILQGHSGPIISAEFASDGSAILTRGVDKKVMVWDNRGNPLAEIPHQGYVFDASFAPDNKSILTAAANNPAGRWKLNGESVLSIEAHPESHIVAIDMSDNMAYLLTADSKGNVQLRNNTSGVSDTIEAHNSAIVEAGFFQNNIHFFTASKDGTLKIWDVIGGELKLLNSHSDKILSVDVLPQQYLLSTSLDGTAKLWDQNGDVILNFEASEGNRISIDYAQNGEYLLFTPKGSAIVCPIPEKIYQELKQDPPSVAEEKLRQYDFALGELITAVSPSPTLNSTHYQVQLAAYKDTRFFKREKVEQIGQLVQLKKGELTVMLIDNIANQTAAETVLKEARKVGFTSAFIIEPSLPEEEKEPLVIETPAKEIVTTKPSPKEEIITAKGSPPFKIQLASLNKRPAGLQEYQSKIGTIGPVEAWAEGRLTKIGVGGFPNRAAANQVLPAVKRAGFPDAFIKKVE